MKLITWSPIARPISIFSDLEGVLNDFSDLTSPLNYSTSWKPKFEVLNTDSTYCISCLLYTSPSPRD